MLKIKNTLTKSKEEFIPIEEKKVRFYQCGATVYWNQHIGNMRAVVLADFINRSFQYLKYEVSFVRNYTDVGHMTSDGDEGEDKIENRAKIEKKTPKEIADFYIKNFEIDIKKLNTLSPTSQPRATEYIPEQIKMIQSLLDKNFAYITDLAIYFDTSKAKKYHRFSEQSFEENITGAGNGKVLDSDKKNSSDFSLWFFKKGSHEKRTPILKVPLRKWFPWLAFRMFSNG